MLRATLRYPGWCKTLKKIVDLGFLDEEASDLTGMSFADLTRTLIKGPSGDDLIKSTAAFLSIKEDSDVMDRLKWLGLFANDPLPMEKGSNLEVLAARMLSKMSYKSTERDMIVLHHDFVVEFPEEKRKEKITSSLIDFGVPGGDSSMSRTVSLPAAIATRLILEGKIADRGARIPVERSIYEPILAELERLGIVCKETVEAC
jgi:saccharopine dehydrogenase-like NADP-dependent oxidoreductase